MDLRRFAAFILTALIAASAVAPRQNVALADGGYDLRTVSLLSPDVLREYMHPESRHLAEDVVRICAENGVSAEFIVSVMRWERRPDLHNWFGWTGSDGRLMRFGSDRECLEKIIPIIKRNYLSPDGKYFNGYTVSAVSVFYNNSDFWRETISGELSRILEATASPEIFPIAGLFGRRRLLSAVKRAG